MQFSICACTCIYSPLCSVPGWPFALLKGSRGGAAGLLQGSFMLLPVPLPSYGHVVCPAFSARQPSSRSHRGPFYTQ